MQNWYISALKSGIEPSAILIGVFDDEMEDVCKRRGYHYRRYSDLQSNETSVSMHMRTKFGTSCHFVISPSNLAPTLCSTSRC